MDFDKNHVVGLILLFVCFPAFFLSSGITANCIMQSSPLNEILSVVFNSRLSDWKILSFQDWFSYRKKIYLIKISLYLIRFPYIFCVVSKDHFFKKALIVSAWEELYHKSYLTMRFSLFSSDTNNVLEELLPQVNFVLPL